MAVFTPEFEHWRFFSNTNAEPVDPDDALEAEDTAPTVALGDVLRLRGQIHETGNSNSPANATWSIEYEYESGWYATSGGSAHWLPYDGLGSEGSLVAGLLLTNSDTKGEYTETNSNQDTVGKNDWHEFDYCIASVPGQAVAEYTYNFRIKLDGVVVPVGGGFSAPSVDTAAGGVDVSMAVCTAVSSARP